MKREPGVPMKRSGEIAIRRLKLLLVADKADCSPELIEMIRRDICAALSKYMDVDAARMEIAVKHQEDTSSERYTTTLYAKLPVHSMRMKGFF